MLFPWPIKNEFVTILKGKAKLTDPVWGYTTSVFCAGSRPFRDEHVIAHVGFPNINFCGYLNSVGPTSVVSLKPFETPNWLKSFRFSVK